MKKILFAGLLSAIFACGGQGSIAATDSDFNTTDSVDDSVNISDISFDIARVTDSSDALDSLDMDSSDASYSDVDSSDATKFYNGPAIINLQSAGNYAILAKSAISTVPKSMIYGDVGLSPAAASYITGFSLTRVGTYWTSPQVVGQIFAANNDPGTPSLLTVAVLDMQAAYVDGATRPTPDFLNFNTGELGGQTVKPGLYKFGTSVLISTDMTFSGNSNSIWILQISGDLLESNAKHVFLSGGAKAEHIFWQVAGFTSIGTTAHFEGVILCKTKIELKTGATINGDLFSQTAVNLDQNIITKP